MANEIHFTQNDFIDINLKSRLITNNTYNGVKYLELDHKIVFINRLENNSSKSIFHSVSILKNMLIFFVHNYITKVNNM